MQRMVRDVTTCAAARAGGMRSEAGRGAVDNSGQVVAWSSSGLTLEGRMWAGGW